MLQALIDIGVWRRTARRRSAVGLAALACLLAAGCAVESPQVPELDFTISISVADDITTIQEVAEDRSEFLEITDDGRMALRFSTEFDEKTGKAEVGDRLQVTPQSADFGTQLGLITIPGQDIPDITIPMSSLVPGLITGIVIPEVPAVAFADPEPVPLDIEGVTLLVIEEGGLDVTLQNGLPLPLASIVLSLRDEASNTVVSTLDLGSIPAGETRSGSFELDGKSMSGSLSVAVAGGTAAASNVTVSADAQLVITASLRDLTVSEATALIPEQQFEDSQELDFPDNRILIDTAVISEGGLTLRVTNEIPVIMALVLSLPDLKRPDGSANVFPISGLAFGETQEVMFDLNNNTFSPEDPQKLRLTYSASTVPSGTEVTIRSNSEIRVEAIPEKLAFSLVEGRLNELSVPIPPVEQTVEFPEGLDNIALAATKLTVYLRSAVGFQSAIDLVIDGTNSQGITKSIIIQEVFPRGDPDSPVSIVISPDSEDLTDFLNNLPSQITVTPTVKIGDGLGTESIAPAHFVQIDSVVFQAPARFRIKENTQIQPAPVRQTFTDSTARARIRGNNALREVTVFTKITNGIPLGLGVRLFVAATEGDVYTNPDLTIPDIATEEPFQVPASSVQENTVTIPGPDPDDPKNPDKNPLNLLIREEYWTGVQVDIDATDGDVELLATDAVRVQAGARIVLRLSEDLVE